MNREQRKRTLHARCEDSEPEPFTLSEEVWGQALEEMERSSERRFETARSPELIASISKTTKSFQTEHGLSVAVTGSVEKIPDIPRNSLFKYSRPYGEGDLPECSQRISNGEKITVALICEDGLLVGYGIAVTREVGSEIEVIDVDCYSRREADLKGTVEVGGEVFQVGVGHVIVIALMEACPRPVKVNATTPHSRYVFKSLGFVHDDYIDNPCILVLRG